MPRRWLLPLGAGSQPRLNLPTPLTAQPPAITDGSVRRQPDTLCSRRRYILGDITSYQDGGKCCTMIVGKAGRAQ